MMTQKNDFRPFIRELRKLDFLPDFDSRAGGIRCCQFFKKVKQGRNERLIEVQLWAVGEHRVSHMLNGHGTLAPTPFDTIASMKTAIEFELTRTKDTQVPSMDRKDIPSPGRTTTEYERMKEAGISPRSEHPIVDRLEPKGG